MFVPFIKTYSELRQFLSFVHITRPDLLDDTLCIDCYEQWNGCRLEHDENGYYFVSVTTKNEKTHTWRDIKNMLCTADGNTMRIKVDGDAKLKCVYYDDPNIEHVNDMEERCKLYRIVDGTFVISHDLNDMPLFMMPIESAYNS